MVGLCILPNGGAPEAQTMIALDIVRKTSYHCMRDRYESPGESLRQYTSSGMMICLIPARVSSCARDIRELHCDAQGEMMARKDLEKETERPRYYSQFWLDVAAGRRVIGIGKGTQDSDEAEAPEMEQGPEAGLKGGKGARGGTAAPFVEAEPAASRQPPQPLRLSGTESLADLAAAAGLVDIEPIDEAAPDLESEEMIDDLEPFPSAGGEPEAEPEEEAYSYNDLYDEEEEDEEEESDDWPPSRRGKKQQHNKKPEKPRRREKGRDF